MEAVHQGDAQGINSQISAINFNGGGHINHSILWQTLAPKSRQGGTLPSSGPFKDAVVEQFGGFPELINLMNVAGLAHQGSGWIWLGYNKALKRLEITSCQNQDPLVTKGQIPLLGIDVWEHAYYLQYKNVRGDYLKRIWEVIHWKDVADRYAKAISS
jgi:Fe-Mn family superoxide dismutase